MNFIQILEPEIKEKNTQKQYAIGIDLGTTNSVVASMVDGNPEVLGPILPSVHQDIRSIKRLMGSNEKVKSLSPVEISAQILQKLKLQAEEILREEITKAVITVPAHFDDAARNDTKLAAKLIGLEVLRLINEPTAAAVAYGLDNSLEGYYLIYDLGGGTFDVSVLRMEKGVFQVLAHGGNRNLGGDDFDYKIMEHLGLLEDSYHLARKAKEDLSAVDALKLNDKELTRAEFERIISPYIKETIDICKKTIQESKIDISMLKEVVLVGGSTRIPLVRKMIEQELKKPLDNIDPDRVVAIGAAIQADALVNGSDNILLDVTSLSIGLEIMGGMNERVINKNSSIPLSVTKYFTTYQDNQTGIQFHIVQGEREMVADCRSLAKFELKGIPPMKASLARVAVTFKIDADGLLNISAIEELSGVHQEIEVKPSYGLTIDKIDEMLEQSYLHAKEDIELKKLAEAKFEASNNVNNVSKAIEEDGDLLRGEEKNKLLFLISELQQAVSSNNLKLIEEKNDKLDKEASGFIQNRLNRQIKEILGGKAVESINI